MDGPAVQKPVPNGPIFQYGPTSRNESCTFVPSVSQSRSNPGRWSCIARPISFIHLQNIDRMMREMAQSIWSFRCWPVHTLVLLISGQDHLSDIPSGPHLLHLLCISRCGRDINPRVCTQALQTCTNSNPKDRLTQFNEMTIIPFCFYKKVNRTSQT